MKRAKRSRPSAGKRKFHLKGLKNHPLVIPVSTFMVLFFVTIVAIIAVGGSTLGASDSRIVQLTLDGKKQTFPTRAATVGDLLQRLHIQTEGNDVVTPSTDTAILDDNFQVTVSHAKPVIVVDGDKKTLTYSAAQDPAAVAADAGVNVYPEDKVIKQAAIDKPTEVLKDGIVAETLVIDRATTVNINLYGTPIQVRSRSNTVGDVLKEKNIKTAADDTIQPAPNTPITNDIQIFIVRVGQQVQSVEEAIPAPVQTINDPTLSAGQTVIKQPGAPGKKVVTYQIQLQNNKEIGRTPIQEIVVSQPVTQVVARGTKVLLTGSKADWLAASKVSAGDYGSADFVISHESGWRPAAVSANRCIGLGQSCGSALANACPDWASNPVCQLNFFDNYAKSRYGGWGGAYQFWLVNRWW